MTVMDVMAPLCALLSCNLLVLALWTGLYPITWEREVIAYDDYGRKTESVGFCDAEKLNAFIVPILLVDGVAMLLALWQAYLCRKIETEFSESAYIGVAVVCIFQAL